MSTRLPTASSAVEPLRGYEKKEDRKVFLFFVPVCYPPPLNPPPVRGTLFVGELHTFCPLGREPWMRLPSRGRVQQQPIINLLVCPSSVRKEDNEVGNRNYRSRKGICHPNNCLYDRHKIEMRLLHRREFPISPTIEWLLKRPEISTNTYLFASLIIAMLRLPTYATQSNILLCNLL